MIFIGKKREDMQLFEHGANWGKQLTNKSDKEGKIIETIMTKDNHKCDIVESTKKNGKPSYYIYIDDIRFTNQITYKNAKERFERYKTLNWELFIQLYYNKITPEEYTKKIEQEK